MFLECLILEHQMLIESLVKLIGLAHPELLHYYSFLIRKLEQPRFPCFGNYYVMWSFGTLGLLHYEINCRTAIIPPLIIQIGIQIVFSLINKTNKK